MGRTVAATSHQTTTHPAHQIPEQWLHMQVNTWLSAREDRLCCQQQTTQGRQLASVWQALCVPTDSPSDWDLWERACTAEPWRPRVRPWPSALRQWPGMSLSPSVLTSLTLEAVRVLSWPVLRATDQQRGRGRSLSRHLMCLTTGKEMEPVLSVSATGNGNETAVTRNATIKRHRWALGVMGSGEMSDLKFYL